MNAARFPRQSWQESRWRSSCYWLWARCYRAPRIPLPIRRRRRLSSPQPRPRFLRRQASPTQPRAVPQPRAQGLPVALAPRMQTWSQQARAPALPLPTRARKARGPAAPSACGFLQRAILQMKAAHVLHPGATSTASEAKRARSTMPPFRRLGWAHGPLPPHIPQTSPGSRAWPQKVTSIACPESTGLRGPGLRALSIMRLSLHRAVE